MRKAQAELVNKLRADAKIERLDKKDAARRSRSRSTTRSSAGEVDLRALDRFIGSRPEHLASS